MEGGAAHAERASALVSIGILSQDAEGRVPDGKEDLLLRRTDGMYGIWLMDGLSIRSPAVVLDRGTGWEVSPR